MTVKNNIKTKSNKDPYHHGDLRNTLINTARSLLEKNGEEALSLRGVARKVGVSRAAPYHYFKSKSALLSAVATVGYMELTDTMVEEAKSAITPNDMLNKLGVGYIKFSVKHPQLFILMSDPVLDINGTSSELSNAREASAAPLLEAVAACIPNGTKEQIGAGGAAAWSIVHGMATLYNNKRLSSLLDTHDLEYSAQMVTHQLDVTKILTFS